jgi:ribose 5-phosphate isomerase
VVTDNGNFIVDWKFPTDDDFDWESMSIRLKMIPGDLTFQKYLVFSSTVISLQTLPAWSMDMKMVDSPCQHIMCQ